MRPRLLDLFCGAGGCSVGYHRAGFEVVGVDNRPQPHYPFEFHQADAMTYPLDGFDAIHASPPCQAYSVSRHTHAAVHPRLLEPTRQALIATGRPYVIENVEGAPLINPVRLCGTEFGLVTVDRDGEPIELRRHRMFESNLFLYGAGGCQHRPITGAAVAGVYGGATRALALDPAAARERQRTVWRGGYVPADKAVRAALLGVDWEMSNDELNQAIPPVYTKYIGVQLLDQLAAVA